MKQFVSTSLDLLSFIYCHFYTVKFYTDTQMSNEDSTMVFYRFKKDIIDDGNISRT